MLAVQTHLDGDGAVRGADSGSSQPSPAAAVVPQLASAGGLAPLSAARGAPEASCRGGEVDRHGEEHK